MRVLGSAWPRHFNKTVAETMHKNIEAVGLPQWTEADQTLAKALQAELKVPDTGLATKLQPLRGREVMPDDEKRGGGSDDIGDVSWTVPTVTLRFPANIDAGPGHNWANAISMATPIAHKGIQYGVEGDGADRARPPDAARARHAGVGLLQERPDEGHEVRRRSSAPEDKPAIWLNQQIMAKYRTEMKKYYYDPSKYKSYLEQLGITYPTVRTTKPSAQ